MGFTLPGIGTGGKTNSGIDKSKNSATATYTDNSNVAASDASLAIRADQVSIQDGGSIARAFDFATDAIGRAAAITTGALSVTERNSRESLQAVIDSTTEQQKAGVQGLTENIFKWGIGGLAVLGIAYAIVATNRKKAA